MITGKTPRVIRADKVVAKLQDILGKALQDSPADRVQTAQHRPDPRSCDSRVRLERSGVDNTKNDKTLIHRH